MKISILVSIVFALLSCVSTTEDKEKKLAKKENDKQSTESHSDPNASYTVVAELPKKLKEISGIAKDGNFIWAISDNPKINIFKLDLTGKVVQQVSLKNITVMDVEDVTVDKEYLYIADVGDNEGGRADRQIIKINKKPLSTGETIQVEGEIINFSFPGNERPKKKENDFDCEAVVSSNESLYLFTKRRSDGKTEMFQLSKATGKQTPKAIGTFDSKGLITGAALNEAGNELALVGYQKGHKQPFIWLLSEFPGNKFFSGKEQRHVLTNTKKDWQVESVTFKDNQTLFFACEETPDAKATLYEIDRGVIR